MLYVEKLTKERTAVYKSQDDAEEFVPGMQSHGDVVQAGSNESVTPGNRLEKRGVVIIYHLQDWTSSLRKTG